MMLKRNYDSSKIFKEIRQRHYANSKIFKEIRQRNKNLAEYIAKGGVTITGDSAEQALSRVPNAESLLSYARNHGSIRSIAIDKAEAPKIYVIISYTSEDAPLDASCIEDDIQSIVGDTCVVINSDEIDVFADLTRTVTYINANSIDTSIVSVSFEKLFRTVVYSLGEPQDDSQTSEF